MGETQENMQFQYIMVETRTKAGHPMGTQRKGTWVFLGVHGRFPGLRDTWAEYLEMWEIGQVTKVCMWGHTEPGNRTRKGKVMEISNSTGVGSSKEFIIHVTSFSIY